MKLKEICERTGLTKRTVRFYDQKELLSPQKTYKNGREYRDYTEDDVVRLQDIATLRRARFTIQEIKQMENRPEDMQKVFSSYRAGLYKQQKELADLIAAAEGVNPEELTSTKQLISILQRATQKLPLPVMDIRPRFRYLDEQEDIYAEFRNRKKAVQAKKEAEGLRIGMHAAISTRAAYTKGTTRSLDLGNEQKLAVMQMLRDDRE